MCAKEKQMDSKELAKAFVKFAEENRDTLANLNRKAIKAIEPLNALSISVSSIDLGNSQKQVEEKLNSLSNAYTALMKETKQISNINEMIGKKLSDLHLETLQQLAKSYPTKMISNLSTCFANAKYGELGTIINESVTSGTIYAPDISFIKTSPLIQIFGDEIEYPRGLKSSLNVLNKTTAADVATNVSLKYDVKENLFVSLKGEVDSKGLNVVCAGRDVLNTVGDELFTDNELVDFISYLSNTPMMGPESVTGKKIQKLIKELFERTSHTISFDESVYFHCRAHNQDEMHFTYDKMLKAPSGLPWAGRYNNVGQSHYYFSNTREGAETEVRGHITKDKVLQTIRLIPKKSIVMLDLSETLARGKTFLKYLRYKVSDVNDKMPREYLIPCFVANCCKGIGFEGIKYHGSKKYSNYVVWDDGYFKYGGMC